MPKPKPHILVQAGHTSPREPGFESGTGAGGEIELVAKIADALVKRLKARQAFQGQALLRQDPAPAAVPLRRLPQPPRRRLQHPRTTRGYSFGWPPSEWGPQTQRLVTYLRDEYERLPGHPPAFRDNYTSNMSGYYGWSRTRAEAKVLIEHGFLSNPADRAWMYANTAAIAAAWHRALERHFDLQFERAETKKPLPGPRRKPSWYWASLKEFLRRRDRKKPQL